MIYKIVHKFNKLLFCLFSIIFIILGIIGILKPDKEYRVSKGTISNIEEYYDQDGSLCYSVFINYKAGGRVFTNVEYGAYDSSMKVGDIVNVYYDPQNPSLFQSEGYKKTPYFVIGFGVLFLIIGLFFIR